MSCTEDEVPGPEELITPAPNTGIRYWARELLMLPLLHLLEVCGPSGTTTMRYPAYNTSSHGIPAHAESFAVVVYFANSFALVGRQGTWAYISQ